MDDEGYNAAHRACEKGFVPTMQAVYESVSQVRSYGSGEDARNQAMKVVIDTKTNEQQTCLHSARQKGKCLRTEGAGLEFRNIEGQKHLHIEHRTCLHIAAANGVGGAVCWLLEKGANPEVPDPMKRLLMRYVSQGN